MCGRPTLVILRFLAAREGGSPNPCIVQGSTVYATICYWSLRAGGKILTSQTLSENSPGAAQPKSHSISKVGKAGQRAPALLPRCPHLVRNEDSLQLLQQSICQLKAPERRQQLPDRLLGLPAHVPGAAQEHGHQSPVVLPASTGTDVLGKARHRALHSQPSTSHTPPLSLAQGER